MYSFDPWTVSALAPAAVTFSVPPEAPRPGPRTSEPPQQHPCWRLHTPELCVQADSLEHWLDLNA